MSFTIDVRGIAAAVRAVTYSKLIFRWEENELIEVIELSKHYGDKKAVNNISFKAEDGEVLGFLGPNGAGKSTTMNILTGYISCTSGKALIDGVDILEEPVKAKKNIGYLPEIDRKSVV